jgi:hypothetical protein
MKAVARVIFISPSKDLQKQAEEAMKKLKQPTSSIGAVSSNPTMVTNLEYTKA